MYNYYKFNAGFTITESLITTYQLHGNNRWNPTFTCKEFKTKTFAEVVTFLHDLEGILPPDIVPPEPLSESMRDLTLDDDNVDDDDADVIDADVIDGDSAVVLAINKLGDRLGDRLDVGFAELATKIDESKEIPSQVGIESTVKVVRVKRSPPKWALRAQLK